MRFIDYDEESTAGLFLRIDQIVRHGLGVHGHQTIEERARIVVRDALPSPARNAALILLGPGEPWDRMCRAARALRLRLVDKVRP